MLFEINNYDACSISGLVDVTITWDVGKNPDTFSRSFTKERNAYWYVESTARYVLTLRLENYLKTIKKISGIGVEYWHTPAKEESLKWLWKALIQLTEKDIDAVCKNILHFKDSLMKVMPGEKHRAYVNLKKDVSDILEFSKRNQNGFKIENNLVKTEAV